MKCPACQNPLQPKNAGPDLTLDICYGGCGGIWFDYKELERASASAPAATTLHSIWQIPSSTAHVTRVRTCPRCPDKALDRRWFSDAKTVEIDRCPDCKGIWLRSPAAIGERWVLFARGRLSASQWPLGFSQC